MSDPSEMLGGDKPGWEFKQVNAQRDPAEMQQRFLDQYYRIFGGKQPVEGSPVQGMQKNLSGFYGQEFPQYADNLALTNAFYSRPRFYKQEKRRVWDDGGFMGQMGDMPSPGNGFGLF